MSVMSFFIRTFAIPFRILIKNRYNDTNRY